MRRFIVTLAVALAVLAPPPGQAQGTQAGAASRQLFKEGFDLLQAGQLPAASAKFEQGLRGDPNNAIAHFYLAETYFGQNNAAKARPGYQKALQLNLTGDLAEKAKERLAGLEGGGNPPQAPATRPTAGATGALPAGKEFKDCDACPVMVVLPPGQFVMGSPPSETDRRDNEGPPHVVNLARAFAVGKFEVTFDEWNVCVADKACREADDKGYGRGKRPVIMVSHEQAVGYAEWLSEKTKKNYRLLSESEWEYAARAGSDKARHWGTSNDRACEFANVNDVTSKRVNNFSWAQFDCDDGHAQTAPVGSFKPNGFGLHDMMGNVAEWTQDCYNKAYEGAPADGSAWMAGDCSLRVSRGGSWYDFPSGVRSANRFRYSPSNRNYYLGFRLARTLP